MFQHTSAFDGFTIEWRCSVWRWGKKTNVKSWYISEAQSTFSLWNTRANGRAFYKLCPTLDGTLAHFSALTTLTQFWVFNTLNGETLAGGGERICFVCTVCTPIIQTTCVSCLHVCACERPQRAWRFSENEWESALRKHHPELTEPGNWSLKKKNHLAHQLSKQINKRKNETPQRGGGLRGDERQLCSLSRSTWMHLQRKRLFSQRNESHAEAVRPLLVSKCVIIVSFGTAPSSWVTLWPASFAHGPPGDAERANASQSLSNRRPRGRLWYRVIDDVNVSYIRGQKHARDTEKTDDGSWREGISDSPASATWQKYHWWAPFAGTIRAVTETRKITSAGIRIDTSKLSSH